MSAEFILFQIAIYGKMEQKCIESHTIMIYFILNNANQIAFEQLIK